jgi:hypothetical protein
MDYCSIKLVERKCPVCFCVRARARVCVCVCHNGVAFVEGILIWTTVEGRFKKVCGALEIFNPDENFVFLIILFSDRF